MKVARRPAAVVEGDLIPLRAAGLSDRDIHDACAVAAYYCFVNRMANGLGVELEGDLRESGDRVPADSRAPSGE